jgi:hypothetical protein
VIDYLQSGERQGKMESGEKLLYGCGFTQKQGITA